MSTEKDLGERLKFAVTKGDVKTAKRLIKGGVDVNSKFWYHASLLHEAIAFNHLDLFRLLLSAGARVNSCNKDGRTPLHTATRCGHMAMVGELIKNKADVSASTKDGRTCLHIAAWRGNEELLQCLLAAGCPVNKQDEDGWTVLHWLYNLKHKITAEKILGRGAQINVLNKNGHTPLQLCILHGNTQMAEILLRHGAVPPDLGVITSKCLFGSKSSDPYSSPDADFLTLLSVCGFGDSVLFGKAASQINSDRCKLLKLSDLCRNKLRKHLLVVSRDRSIIGRLKRLPLPAPIKDYLCLDQL